MDNLFINRAEKADRIAYTFMDIGQLGAGPTQSMSLIEIRRDLVGPLTDGFVEAGETQTEESLRVCGYNLWLSLPEPVRRLLFGKETPLTLTLDHAAMPWELVYGQDYLSLQRTVVRRAAHHNVSSEDRPGIAAGSQSHKWLVVGDPKCDLPGARKEVAELKNLAGDLSDMHHQITFIAGTARQANILRVRDQLASGCMIFHYSGHADYETGALLLNDASLAPADIESLLRESACKPVVFLNACSTDRMRRPGSYSALSDSIAGAFLAGGARLVISTLWKIPDASACEFAVLFYRHVFDGLTFGEALLAARRERRRQAPNDPTWAAFVMYGDPEYRLVLGPGWRDYTRLQIEAAAAGAARMVGVATFDIEHLILALASDRNTLGVAWPALDHTLTSAALRRLGIDCSALVEAIRSAAQEGAPLSSDVPCALGPGVSRVFAAAFHDRMRRGARAGVLLNEADILLAMLKDSKTQSLLSRYLAVDPLRILAVVLDLMGTSAPAAFLHSTLTQEQQRA